ncbi:MAG: hypothetical protein AABZ55_05545 [Bdellovibrionota bacterium]
MKLSNSVLNISATINDIISDVFTLLNTPISATGRASDRIAVCTNNLLEAMGDHEVGPNHFLNPSSHIAIVIDDSLETADPRSGGNEIRRSKQHLGGAVCTPVTVYNNDSDSRVIENMMCISQFYRRNAPYDFWGYNCGGFTKDVLEYSESHLNIIPNLGIGAQISLALSESDDIKRKIALKAAKNICDNHLTRMNQIILTLEMGSSLSENDKKYIENIPTKLPTPDMYFQLLVSAARGHNENNRSSLQGFFKDRDAILDNYILKNSDGDISLKPFAGPVLSSIVFNTNELDLKWLQSNSEKSKLLLQMLEK